MVSAKFEKLVDACNRGEAMDVCIAQVEKYEVVLEFNVDSAVIGGPACPSAGLPNAMGVYDGDPEMLSDYYPGYAKIGMIDSGVGCRGTFPSRINSVMRSVKVSLRAGSWRSHSTQS